MSLAQAQAKFETDAANKGGGGEAAADEAYAGVAAPWATQAESWAGGYSQMAQAEGLLIVLRAGPFICDGPDYGGFPWWLTQ